MSERYNGSVQRVDQPVEYLEQAWEQYLRCGFVILDDTNEDFGMDPAFRTHLSEHYFDGGAMRAESYRDVHPADRERADDTIIFMTGEHGGVLLGKYKPHEDTVAIHDRRYPRLDTLEDPPFAFWLEAVLNVLPPDMYDQTTLGLHLLRTRTSVVSGPHQDHADVVMTYVVNKQCGGAVSTLYRPGERQPFVSVALKPGQLMVFEDGLYEHNVSRLQPLTPGAAACRDVVICNINPPVYADADQFAVENFFEPTAV